MSIAQQIIGESRPTNAFEITSKIGKIPGVETIDTWSQSDGYATLIKVTEGPYKGQAYEVQVRPAAYAKHPSLNANYGTGRGTARLARKPVGEAVDDGHEFEDIMDDFFKLEPELRMAIRQAAVENLKRQGFDEIGTSDVNHSIVSMFKSHGDWQSVARELVD